VILLLTHGAGANRDSALLTALDAAFTAAEVKVVRYNLPYRDQRPSGPPRRGDDVEARLAMRERIAQARAAHPDELVIGGGHSYGGRQTSMLAAEDSSLLDGLLLLSYPLHPPRQPEQLRTQHFPPLRTPALFVHGARDPFGSPDEMRSALELIPARHELVVLERAGHELTNHGADLGRKIVLAFQQFFG
jgi:predicted alpha/beta-hydrolase family hydrolase